MIIIIELLNKKKKVIGYVEGKKYFWKPIYRRDLDEDMDISNFKFILKLIYSFNISSIFFPSFFIIGTCP